MGRRTIFTVALSIGLAAGAAAGADDINIAPRGTATQSTTGWGGEASRAIDGNTDGLYGNNSTTHTASGDAAPWWQVDLGPSCDGGMFSLTRIVIWGRTDDCCRLRLTNFTVSILDEGGGEVWKELFFDDCSYPDTRVEGFEIALPEGTKGRIVRIDLIACDPAQKYLSLAEVQVFSDLQGCPVEIRRQPESVRVNEGRKATISVLAYGELPLHYRWFKGDDEIPDSDSPALTFDPAKKSDAGEYRVVVSNAATPEGVASDSATLTVTSRNLALAGRAWQSSEGYGGAATRAIDGNTDGNWAVGSTTHTAGGDIAPTWEVGLLVEGTIDTIAIWTRADCCWERLSNFRVTVFDSARDVTYAEEFFTDGVGYPAPGEPFEIPMPVPTKARYVRVELASPNRTAAPELLLSLAEVEVLGESPDPPPDPNLARKGMATQSSQLGGFSAALAIDGNRSNFTHTLSSDPTPTWQIDLGAMTEIGEIVLFNRSDCCGSRLRDITVSILDEAGGPVYASELLNPENELGAYPNGPATLTVDLLEELGATVQGRIVRISRTPDPDLSGSGGQGNPDEASVLSLAEVEIYAEPCPAVGDTHCAGFALLGPKEGQPGIYRLVATAADDSDDLPDYTFSAGDGVNPPGVVGPRLANFAFFAMGQGDWTLSVSTDDGARCPDLAADATCEIGTSPAPHPDNVAVLGIATQSTTGWGGVPERAIDGNTNGLWAYGSVTHTADGDPAPWWDVDLQDLYPLDRIVLWSRLDCCWERLVDIRVSVLDEVRDPVFEETYLEDLASWPYTLQEGFEIALPAGTEGRFVRIERIGPDAKGATLLSLAEVEVYRVPPVVETLFKRGYVNDDASLDLGDAIYVLNYLFAGGDPPPCVKAADMDDEMGLTIGDAIYLLSYIFADGAEPMPPFAACGADPTPDDGLSCERSPVCP